MGGSTIVLVESALQDVMWMMAKNRCPPEIMKQTRSRVQRLMSDVALSQSLAEKESEESIDDFCSNIVCDVVDDVLHTKIPFCEVEILRSEVERVAFQNEELKIRIEEKNELASLRQIAMNRKHDGLLYSLHKYFEEVFLLRKEKVQLTQLLRQAQKKMRTMTVALNSHSHSQHPQNNNTNSNVAILSPSTSSPSASSSSNLGTQLFGASHQTNNNSHSNSNINNKNESSQQNDTSNIFHPTEEDIENSLTNPGTAGKNNAIFEYDELAVRMMLDDPDLAELKMRIVKLCREFEEQKSTNRKQKADLIDRYENKIRRLEIQLNKALELLSIANEETGGRNRVMINKMVPIQAQVLHLAESFDRTRNAIKDVLGDFLVTFDAGREATSEAVGQLVANEDICLGQVQCATDYIAALCVGDNTVSASEKQQQQEQNEKNNNSSEEGKEKRNVVAENNNENSNENEENQEEQEDQEEERSKTPTLLSPIESAKQHFEVSLQINPFDDKADARAKRYWQQHDLTALLRCSITAVSKNTTQFSELIRRLNLLSEFSTRDNKKNEKLFIKNNLLLLEMAKQQAHQIQEQKKKEKELADRNLLALSAAANICTTRKMYMRLFEIASENNNNNNNNNVFLKRYGTIQDQKLINETEEVVTENTKKSMKNLRFKRICARIRRRKMLEVYDSFRPLVVTNESELFHQSLKAEREQQEQQQRRKSEENENDNGNDNNIENNDDGNPTTTFSSDFTAFGVPEKQEAKEQEQEEDEKEKENNNEQEEETAAATTNTNETEKEHKETTQANHNHNYSKFLFSGCFENVESYEKWRTRLCWFSLHEDSKFDLLLSQSADKTRLLVTSMVSQLPGTLLATFIGDTESKLLEILEKEKQKKEDQLFYDQELLRRNENARRSNNAGDGDEFYDDDEPQPFWINDDLTSEHIKMMTMNANNNIDATSGGKRKMKRHIGVGTSPHSSFVFNHKNNGNNIFSSSSSSKSPNSRYLLHVDKNHQRRKTKRKRKGEGSDENDEDEEEESENEEHFDDDENYDELSASGKRKNGEKRLRFAAQVTEVAPDQMIPETLAASENRHGYFSPQPTSHFMHRDYHNRGGDDNSNINNTLSSSINRTPVPPSILRGSSSSPYDSVNSTVQLPNSNNKNFIPRPPSSSSQSYSYASSPSPFATTFPFNLNFPVGKNFNAESWQEMQQLLYSGQIQGLTISQQQKLEKELMQHLEKLHAKRFSTSSSSEKSKQKQDQQEQQQEESEKEKEEVVAASLENPLDHIEMDQINENENEIDADDLDSKLLQISRIKTRATPPPCVISTLGGIGPIDLQQKSVELSTRAAARKFIGQNLIAQAQGVEMCGRNSPSIPSKNNYNYNYDDNDDEGNNNNNEEEEEEKNDDDDNVNEEKNIIKKQKNRKKTPIRGRITSLTNTRRTPTPPTFKTEIINNQIPVSVLETLSVGKF